MFSRKEFTRGFVGANPNCDGPSPLRQRMLFGLATAAALLLGASCSSDTNPSGASVCAGQTVNLQESPLHCGQCGNVCQSGKCSAGICEAAAVGGTGGAGGSKPATGATSGLGASTGATLGGSGGTGAIANTGGSTKGGTTGSAMGGAGGGTAKGGTTGTGATGSGGASVVTGPSCMMGTGGTPVSRCGQLKVSGGKLVGKDGIPVQLKGPSSMWLNWEGDNYAESKEALQWMRDNWKLSLIRAAMGVEPAKDKNGQSGGYLVDPDTNKANVETIIKNAIALGVYVLVDWHDHNAASHTADAQKFFTEMATKYGKEPNVIWETFNEPLKVDWSTTLKPYHTAVVKSIRDAGSENVVVLGTPNWSQDVEAAAGDPMTGSNLMYTLHFYSCSHTQKLRDKADQALGKGLPLFVTEWGATNADGGLDGLLCLPEAQLWHDWMKKNSISWAAWKLDNCEPDSSCILAKGAPKTGGWTDNFLHGHGPFVRDRMKE